MLLDKDVTMAVEQRETTSAVGPVRAILSEGGAEMPSYNPELSYRAFPDPHIVESAKDNGEGKRRLHVARILNRALDALP